MFFSGFYRYYIHSQTVCMQVKHSHKLKLTSKKYEKQMGLEVLKCLQHRFSINVSCV